MGANCVANQIIFFGISDRGLQREKNEDHFIVADLTRKVIGVEDNRVTADLIEHDIGTYGTLLAVADGLGGHEGGEIASRLAANVTAQTLCSTPQPSRPLHEWLIDAVHTAHNAICGYHGDHAGVRRMASTLTAVHAGRQEMTIVQIGDSRAYRFGHGKLTLLTEDQTLVYMMQKKGILTDEEARNHPNRNVIIQALGQGKSVSPVIQTFPWHENDCLLLCTDGLSSYVSHDDIEAILAAEPDANACCRRLVEAANEAGGADNVTVLLVRVLTTTPSEVAEAQSHAEHTEAPGTASASHGLGAMSASSIISTVDLPWRWLRKMTGKDEPTTEAAAEEPTPSLKEKKRFWSNKRTEAQESAETSFWKQELHWPWRNRAMKRLGDETPEPAPVQPPKDLPVAPQKESPVSRQPGEQAGEPEESKLRRLRQKKSAASPAWDPNVLRTLEERLAEYIGPVAKILVRRAANETRDIDELCQLLATQLATEQEKKNFLRTVNPH